MKDKKSEKNKSVNQNTRDVFLENEVRSNNVVMVGMIIAVIGILIICLAVKVGFYNPTKFIMGDYMIWHIIILLGPVVLNLYFKGRKPWLKYLLIFSFIVILAQLDYSMTYAAPLLIAIPVVLSSKYFSYKFTGFIIVTSVIIFFISSMLGVTGGHLDVNLVWLPKGTVLNVDGFIVGALQNVDYDTGLLRYNALIYRFIPKLIMYAPIAVACLSIAYTGHMMVLKQASLTEESVKMSTELALASAIQESVIPDQKHILTGCSEIVVDARVVPAKEVGGDFYDFFMVDKDHIAFVMADVSGKGVPASLYMMMARSTIHDLALSGLTPKEVMEEANRRLCGNGLNDTFVTTWFGLLDLTTGVIRAVNAGHMKPVVKNPGGKYELLNDKSGFVLGGLPEITYDEYEIRLEPGSNILLYTDGVTETENPVHDQFGVDGLLRSLRCHKDADLDTLLECVYKNLQDFAGTAPQFDDITMLFVRYLGKN